MGTATTTSAGLTSAQAAERLLRDGPNAVPHPDRRRWTAMLGSVVREPMLLLLIAATVLYLLIGEARDAATLAISVVLVVALTLYQELRSERALQALRDLASPTAHVRRDGTLQQVSATELVVGDLVRVAEGDRIPADARMLAGSDLHVDESLLTGESTPVAHDAHATEAGGANLAGGTLVVRGEATAEVIATGARTQMGRIGASLNTIRSEPTLLQEEMRRLVVLFAAVGIASCVVLLVLYLALRGGWEQALLASITLAMSNIPEEFPVVLTVFLALGAWRMARKRVLVRRPPAIEALGTVTVLCTDKTGTLTENRMAVARWAADEALAVSALGSAPGPEAQALLQCASLASDADGLDPMDRAIQAAAHPSGGNRTATACVRHYPVSPQLPVYANAWRQAGRSGLLVACKGAPETVAALCALPQAQHARVMRQAEAMAADGLRVIAVARSEYGDESASPPASITDLPFQWLGLLGLADPLRTAVPAAVDEARAAGVRVIMMTGDHAETARAIAAAARIDTSGGVALGRDLDDLDPAGLSELLERTQLFARVRPEHKLRLVEALKGQGAIVAMTGDGVNDAPALAAAHVGIAMGGRGTDVAREAAAIVLLDDDFTSVVRAIRLGRGIYDNIRRAARYIIAAHVPITGLALMPLLLGTPLILQPLHVVFLEMIIDPVSSIVLEREPAAGDIMHRPPRSPHARLIGLRTLLASMGRGLIVLAAVAAAYTGAAYAGLPSPQRGALAFIALVAGNLGLVVLHRSGPAFRKLQRHDIAFGFIAMPTLALLAAIALRPAVAAWFGFAPPPLPAAALALLLPWGALWGTSWLGARLRRTSGRASGQEGRST
ncbi:cation-translocating P-type ATPase [Luteimonas sp. 22616]|uniref:cation-translocating P-type ATPase n=1 Tax=Luteimonas sp. 22616 TaxID=3453951 RepID=UPI003F87D901